MKKEYFADHISTETMAKLLDKTINFEKNNKIRKRQMNMLKIIPAAAAIVLVIGLANFIGFVDIDNIIGAGNPGETPVIEENILYAEYEDITNPFGNYVDMVDIVCRFLAGEIPDNDDYFRTFTEPFVTGTIDVPELECKLLISVYNLAKDGEAEDLRISFLDVIGDKAVILELLDTLKFGTAENPGSHEEYRKADYENIESDFLTRDPELYSHVRFGGNKNILLLDIEWHTPESYAELVEERKKRFSEPEAMQHVPPGFDWNEVIERWENELSEVTDGKLWISKSVNGINNGDGLFYLGTDADKTPEEFYSEWFDSDGYYILNIYPHGVHVTYNYNYENGEYEIKRFGNDEYGRVFSKEEFDFVVKNEVIPFLDELLEKDLINRQYYDNIIKDPLDAAVERYFGWGD